MDDVLVNVNEKKVALTYLNANLVKLVQDLLYKSLRQHRRFQNLTFAPQNISKMVLWKIGKRDIVLVRKKGKIKCVGI